MYEWDEAKNRANIAKHGIGFDLACRIFEGPVFTLRDTRQDYGEISIGQVEGIAVIVVVHTERQSRRRLISARPASQRERTRYADALRQADDPA